MTVQFNPHFPLTLTLPMNLKMPRLIINTLRILKFKGAKRALVRGNLSPNPGGQEPYFFPGSRSTKPASMNWPPVAFRQWIAITLDPALRVVAADKLMETG